MGYDSRHPSAVHGAGKDDDGSEKRAKYLRRWKTMVAVSANLPAPGNFAAIGLQNWIQSHARILSKACSSDHFAGDELDKAKAEQRAKEDKIWMEFRRNVETFCAQMMGLPSSTGPSAVRAFERSLKDKLSTPGTNRPRKSTVVPTLPLADRLLHGDRHAAERSSLPEVQMGAREGGIGGGHATERGSVRVGRASYESRIIDDGKSSRRGALTERLSRRVGDGLAAGQWHGVERDRFGVDKVNLGVSEQIWIETGRNGKQGEAQGKAGGDWEGNRGQGGERYSKLEQDCRDRNAVMIKNLKRGHGGGPSEPPWEIASMRSGGGKKQVIDDGAWEKKAEEITDLARQRNQQRIKNASLSHGSHVPPWEKDVLEHGSEFALEGELRGFAKSRRKPRRDPDDAMWREPLPPPREYKVPMLPPPREDEEAEIVLRTWRGNDRGRMEPLEVRKKYGGRMGPGAGGRGLMVSDAARARAIEVLKAKEKELVTKIGMSTFRGMMSSQHRPVYREKTDALEFQLREVEVALEYFEHTRNRPFVGRPHRTMDYDGSKTAR